MKRYVYSARSSKENSLFNGYDDKNYVIEIIEEDEDGKSNHVKSTGTDLNQVIKQAVSKCNTIINLPHNKPINERYLVEYLEDDAPDYGWMIIQLKLNGDVIYGLEDDEITTY